MFACAAGPSIKTSETINILQIVKTPRLESQQAEGRSVGYSQGGKRVELESNLNEFQLKESQSPLTTLKCFNDDSFL